MCMPRPDGCYIPIEPPWSLQDPTKRDEIAALTHAIFFDVDFTLIYPGPMFRGEGYHAFCERHGMQVDQSRFDAAVSSAASLLDGPDEAPYDAEIFVRYTRH